MRSAEGRVAAVRPVLPAIVEHGFVEIVSGRTLDVLAGMLASAVRLEGRRSRVVFALAELDVVCGSSAPSSLSIAPGEMLARNPSSTKTYRNAAPLTIRPNATIRTQVEAVEPGDASTSEPHAITELIAPVVADVAVSNPNGAIGRDVEADARFRSRILESLTEPDLGAQVLAALARDVRRADLSLVDVNRVRRSSGLLYVARESDVPSTEDVALLVSVVASGTTPFAAATVRSIDVSYALTVKNLPSAPGEPAAPSTPELEQTIASRLAEHLGSLPIGGHSGLAYRAAIDTAIRAALGTRALSNGVAAPPWIISLDVTTPADDVTVTATEAPIVGAITPSITRI